MGVTRYIEYFGVKFANVIVVIGDDIDNILGCQRNRPHPKKNGIDEKAGIRHPSVRFFLSPPGAIQAEASTGNSPLIAFASGVVMKGNRQSAKPRLATMADVAATAGVSQITVSRALRNPDSVAPETREKIAAAIKQVDYVPNGVAGSLRSRQTNLVAAIIPSITHHFLGRMIQGFSDVLGPSGLHLMLGTSGESLLGEERIVAAFLAQRPRGILLHNTEHTDACRQLLAQSGIPVIETGDLGPNPIDTAVGYSNFDAAFAMTRHLIERGYRRIAFVSRTRPNERAAERLRGYREA
jgi:hypothetical protein